MIATLKGENTVKLTSSFRKIGQLATGLSYGHVHGTIDFKQIVDAQKSVIDTVYERMKSASSKEETLLLEALLPQVDIAMKTVEDLETQFFGQGHHRQKRQLLLGLGVALGLTSLGTSIYTATEVRRLHDEISNLHSRFRHVAHVLDEEAQAVNKLIGSMRTIKATCQIVLRKLDVEEKQIATLTTVIGMMAMISNLNAQLDGWRRGLEFLASGKLHPSLIDHKKIRASARHIEEKARAAGRQPLHKDEEMLFKAPVSYLATGDGKIFFIAHVALVEAKPMDLFELISTPVKVRGLVLEVRAAQKILAVDSKGKTGIEMSHEELVRCLAEEKHDGQVFLCPNANLMRNDIRKTCLGGIFFGLQEEVATKCDHMVHQKTGEDMKQVGKNEVLIYSERNQTLMETCKNGTSYHWIPEGLVTKKVRAGCEVATKDFTFKALREIDTEENFLRREIQSTEFQFLEEKSDEKLLRALEALGKDRYPEPIRTADIKKWIAEDEEEEVARRTHLATSIAAAGLSLIAVGVIGGLFVKFRRARNQSKE